MTVFVFLFCLLFRWGFLHRVLLVVGWCQVLYSNDFLCVSSHYLIPTRVSSEKAMTPHSSTLAWRIPWTEEPGGLQCMGLQKSQTWLTASLSLSFTLDWSSGLCELCIGWDLCWLVCLFVFPLMGKAEWGGNPVCWWLSLYFYLVCCLDEASCTGCYW